MFCLLTRRTRNHLEVRFRLDGPGVAGPASEATIKRERDGEMAAGLGRRRHQSTTSERDALSGHAFTQFRRENGYSRLPSTSFTCEEVHALQRVNQSQRAPFLPSC